MEKPIGTYLSDDTPDNAIKANLVKFLETGNYADLLPERAGDPKWDKSARAKLHTPIISLPKINRNEPCICGSGRKFKQCCLQKQYT